MGYLNSTRNGWDIWSNFFDTQIQSKKKRLFEQDLHRLCKNIADSWKWHYSLGSRREILESNSSTNSGAHMRNLCSCLLLNPPHLHSLFIFKNRNACNFPGKRASNHWCLFSARMRNRESPEIWKIASTPAGGGGGLGNPWAGWQCPFSYWEMQKSRISHSWGASKGSLPSLTSFLLSLHDIKGFSQFFCFVFIPPVLSPIPLWGKRAVLLWGWAAGWG